MMVGGPSYPMFFLVCSNCSHVLTYSAITSGVLEAATPPGVVTTATETSTLTDLAREGGKDG